MNIITSAYLTMSTIIAISGLSAISDFPRIHYIAGYKCRNDNKGFNVEIRIDSTEEIKIQCPSCKKAVWLPSPTYLEKRDYRSVLKSCDAELGVGDHVTEWIDVLEHIELNSGI